MQQKILDSENQFTPCGLIGLPTTTSSSIGSRASSENTIQVPFQDESNVVINWYLQHGLHKNYSPCQNTYFTNPIATAPWFSHCFKKTKKHSDSSIVVKGQAQYSSSIPSFASQPTSESGWIDQCMWIWNRTNLVWYSTWWRTCSRSLPLFLISLISLRWKRSLIRRK